MAAEYEYNEYSKISQMMTQFIDVVITNLDSQENRGNTTTKREADSASEAAAPSQTNEGEHK